MRRAVAIAAFSLLWLLAPSANPGEPGGAFDVSRCDIVIEIVSRPTTHEAAAGDAGPSGCILKARAEVSLRRRSSLVRTIVFRLNSALRVLSVTGDAGQPLPFAVREGGGGVLERLEIDAPPGEVDREPNDETFTIAYEGPLRARVGDVTLGLIEEGRAFAFSAAGWYPLANVSDHFRATVTAKTGKAMTFVANGTPSLVAADETSRTVRFSESKPVAYLSFAAGTYTIHRERHRDLDLCVCLYRHDPELARRYLDEMRKILDFYTERFGPYPYSGLTIAEVDDRFALPRGTSALVLVTSSFVNAHFPDRFADELRVIAHEIAHQWWANLVAIETADDHWLNEGFAEYSALLYHERRSGPERLKSYLRRVAVTATFGGQPTGEPVPLARGADLTNGATLAYAASKGAYVLHMLRLRLGDERFFACLRAYASRFSFRRASTADFVLLASQFAGEDLKGFFEQWIMGTDVPAPRVSYAATASGDGGFRIRGEIAGMPARFRAPVEVRFEGALQESVVTVDCARPSTPFEARIAFRPERVCVDPEGKLLRQPSQEAVEDALLDADTLFFFNRYQEAAARYRDALSIDPYDPRALHGLGRAWLAVGEAELAAVVLARVDSDLIAGEPHLIAWSEIHRGIALDRLGRREEAKAAYERARRTGSNSNGARLIAEEGVRQAMPDRAIR